MFNDVNYNLGDNLMRAIPYAAQIARAFPSEESLKPLQMRTLQRTCFSRLVLAAISVLLLSACALPTRPGTAAIQWSCKVRELQIYPVFPPREDLMVGDMHIRSGSSAPPSTDEAACEVSTRRNFAPIPPYLGAVPGIRADVDDFYSSRLDLPRSPASFGANAQATTYQIPEATGPSLFTSNNPKRLRAVAFPDFMSVRVTGADMGAIVPILGVLSPLGFGTESVDSVSISIPAAESYGIGSAAILDRWFRSVKRDSNGCFEEMTVDVGSRSIALNLEALRLLAQQSETSPADSASKIEISAISEVYYARSIDTSISFKEAFAAGLNRNRGSLPSDSDAPSSPALSISTSGAAVAGQAAGETDARTRIDRTIAALMSQQGSRGGLPGVSLSVRAMSGHGVGLTRTFDRPVAIGYRAIVLSIANDTSTKVADPSKGSVCAKVSSGSATGLVIAPASSPSPLK